MCEGLFALAEAFFLGLERGGQAVQVADFGIDHRLMFGELQFLGLKLGGQSMQLSASLAEQDVKLNERADFIDKKLANRQVSFDRELNECKRAINRKWEVIKQLMAQYVTKETTRTKRLAAMDQQILRFEQSRGAIADITKRQDDLVEKARQAQLDLENKTRQTEQAGA